MKKLSVIVPVYNIERYVGECIASISNQSFQDMEIIIVDDGSTDESGKICDECAKKDSRIRIIHKSNNGLVSARKEGLKNASGEYIVFVDGDDWIEKNACESMVKRIEETQSDIIFYNHYENVGQLQRMVRHNVISGEYDKERLRKLIYPRMISSDSFFEWQVFPAAWDIIVKKELLEKYQFAVNDIVTIGEDAAFIYPCLLAADKVCFEEEAFYHYRQDPNSMVKSKADTARERRCFKALNEGVLSQLAPEFSKYNLKKQWRSFMMFLMLPRADQLFDGYDELPFLYPYREVKKGMRISIYGAGTYGQRLYSYISQTHFCEVVAWYDRDYEELRKQGLNVENPENVYIRPCDGIIIANMFCNSRKQIRDYIRERADIPIFEIDEEYIFSEESLKGFRLN